MKRCCQSLVVFSQTIVRSKSKEKGKGPRCGKYSNKKQNKMFTIVHCRRCVSMIENSISGYLYNELFSKSNEENCTVFQRVAWSRIAHKNPFCSTALQAFLFRSLSWYPLFPLLKRQEYFCSSSAKRSASCICFHKCFNNFHLSKNILTNKFFSLKHVVLQFYLHGAREFLCRFLFEVK